mmetsp:Transcript_12304/g.23897  ORF Transcript_12304/g.23897 Transcript_12304/m.23897 type:complete len:263 (-) Transcript_12304:378-1166(-)
MQAAKRQQCRQHKATLALALCFLVVFKPGSLGFLDSDNRTHSMTNHNHYHYDDLAEALVQCVLVGGVFCSVAKFRCHRMECVQRGKDREASSEQQDKDRREASEQRHMEFKFVAFLLGLIVLGSLSWKLMQNTHHMKNAELEQKKDSDRHELEFQKEKHTEEVAARKREHDFQREKHESESQIEMLKVMGTCLQQQPRDPHMTKALAANYAIASLPSDQRKEALVQHVLPAMIAAPQIIPISTPPMIDQEAEDVAGASNFSH